MSMLSTQALNANNKEREAVDALIEEHSRSDRPASITRSEPGEKGPLRVEIGRRSWLVTRDGKTRKERD